MSLKSQHNESYKWAFIAHFCKVSEILRDIADFHNINFTIVVWRVLFVPFWSQANIIVRLCNIT